MVYGRVYVIRSPQTTDIYIGSTEKKLYERLSKHQTDYKRYLLDKMNYVSSFELLKYEDAYIELIYEGEFENTSALERKEGEYQRSMECVNKHIAGRTHKEWREENKEYKAEFLKKWRDENKEYIAEHNKQNYEKNKEQIAEKNKQKYTCDCGSILCVGSTFLHIKTKKHLEYIKNLSLEK
jgi:hypothetical protein